MARQIYISSTQTLNLPSDVQETPNDIRDNLILFIHRSSRPVSFGNGDTVVGGECVDAKLDINGGGL